MSDTLLRLHEGAVPQVRFGDLRAADPGAAMLHPQPAVNDPQTVRWVSRPGFGPGELLSAPWALQQLLEEQILEWVMIEAEGVWTRLAPHLGWRQLGARVRAALISALNQPNWKLTQGSATLLRMIATDVISGEMGDFISSHGGGIEVVNATTTELMLALGGACSGCPAAGRTLSQRIGSCIARRYPGLVRVSEATCRVSEIP